MEWSGDDGTSTEQAEAPRSHYLTFFIGGGEYGVPILRVREIIELGSITRVPAAPLCVRGVINLRGGVVPIVDLALKFGQPACTVTRFTCVVVVEMSTDDDVIVMGLMVDAVNQTMELADGEIEPVPSFGTLAPADYLIGMATTGDKFVLLLDIDRALSAHELHGAAAVVALKEIESDAEAAADQSATGAPRADEDARDTDVLPAAGQTTESRDA
jgi:purine-binding chemotaxis protein CheW